MSEFEPGNGELPSHNAIDKLFLDLYDDGDEEEALPHDSITMAIHSYLEDGLELSAAQAWSAIKAMYESGSIPGAAAFETNRPEAFAYLKVGLHADLTSLYAGLHGIDGFKEWYAKIMDVVLSGHNEESDDCMLVTGYDETHCREGFCPVKTICNGIMMKLQHPDLSSYEYQFLPHETAAINLAQLEYLVAEEYIEQRRGALTHHYYRYLLEDNLPGFRLYEK